MRKMMKKALSVILVVVIVLTAAPLSGFVGVKLPEWLNFSLKAKATSVSSSEAIAWCESQLGNTLDYDGAYGGQCVDLIMYYYKYLGVSPVGGNACDYATNSLPSGWKRIENGVPQPGDILVYTGGYGHIAIHASDNVSYHQNWSGHYVEKVNRRYSQGYTHNGNTVTYWGCIRPNFADAVVVSGKCGDNLTWKYKMNTGELIISGTGAMYDYSWNSIPWEEYSYGIETVVINDGVTTIGDYAFYECWNITSVKISNSVTKIGNNSFFDCTALTNIIIPDSVTSMGEYAFNDCSSLKNATIGDGITILGEGSFNGCTALESVTIGECVTTIGGRAFLGCSSLSSIIIPSSVTTICYDAFLDCSSLDNVIIGDNVERIESYAFSDTAYYNDEDNWENDVLYIGNHLIEAKENISGEYTIKEGTKTIVDAAFSNCQYLTGITIPDSIKSIGERAFDCCTSLESIVIGESITTIGSYAFFDTKYYNDENNWEDDVLYIDNYLIEAKESIGGEYRIKEGTKIIADLAFSSYIDTTNWLTGIIIPDSVVAIGYRAFANSPYLTHVTIPDSIITIGDFAFYGCMSLTKIFVDDNNINYSSDEYGVLFNKNKTTLIQYPRKNEKTSYEIPKSVTTINYGAFKACQNLTNVTIPNSIISIPDYAFASCQNLLDINIPNSVLMIGEYAFSYCTSITDMTIPNSVISIGNYAFDGCIGLDNIDISNNVTKIGCSAFAYCTSLTNVIIPDNLTSVGSSMFLGCSSLKNIIIPDGLIAISDEMFTGCTSLINVEISDSVRTIGRDAFNGCESLTNVKIGNKVSYIWYSAFDNCISLASIEVSENNLYYSSVDGVLFDDSQSTLVKYPLGKVKATYAIPNSVSFISRYAFYDCVFLTSVTIPNSVINISGNAFCYCDNLSDVHYDGLRKQWENVSISYGNDCLLNATIHYKKEADKKLYFNFSSNKDKIEIGDTVTLGAHYQRGNTTGISYDGDIRWESSNPDVIKIDKYYKNRVCVYLKAKKLGSAKITLYLDNKPVLSETVTVTVSKDTLFKECRDELYNSSKFTILDNARSISKQIINSHDKASRGLSAFFENLQNGLGFGVIANEFLALFGITQGKLEQAEDKAAEMILMEYIGVEDAKGEAVENSQKIFNKIKFVNDAEDLYKDLSNITEYSNAEINRLSGAVDGFVKVEEIGLSIREITAAVVLFAQFELDVIEDIKHSTACGSQLYNALDRLYKKRRDLSAYAKERFFDEQSINLLCELFTSINPTTKVADWIGNGLRLIYDAAGGLDADDYMVAMNSWGFAGYLYNYSIKNTSSISKFERYYEYYVAAVKASLKTAIKISNSNSLTKKANNAYNKIVKKCHSEELFDQVIKENYAEQANAKQLQSFSANEMLSFYNDGNTENIINVPSHIDGNAISAIADNYYEGLTDFQGVVLPLTIETIGNYAFANSSSVEYIYLNEGITSIGNYAFANCSSLQDMNLPDTLQTIGDSSFAGCNGIITLDMGENVTSIGNKAFENCTGLTTVYFRNPNTVIPTDAFDGCSDITIYGYTGSTAQAVAQQYGFEFIAFEQVVADMRIVTPAVKNIFEQGEAISTDGLTIEVTYLNGDKEIISDGWAIAYDMTTPGEKKVVVHYKDGSISYPITVTEKVIDEITLTESEKTLFVTDSYELNAVADVNIALEDLVWSSTDEEIVTVSDSGYITAVGAGSTTVTVRSSNGDVSASCIITVVNKDEITATDEYVRSKIISPTESGYYTFKLENNTDNVTALLCDLNNDVLATKSGVNFEMTVWLVEDESYYFEFHTTGNNNSFTFEVLLPDEQDIPEDYECSHATTEVVNYFAPTCTTAGYAGDVKCLECGEIIESLGDIPSAGHNYSSTVTLPTCTTGGYTTYNCSACGDSYVADEVSATGHLFNKGSCSVCGTKDPSYTEESEYNYTFSIQNPSRTEIPNKDGIILHANVEGNAPDGSYVRWESSNGNFDKSADGSNLKIIAKNKGYTTFTAILCDADGNELARDNVEMYSKSGFFDKIGGFFRGLFGLTKIYEN